ncbi:hypothetical protein [Selenomonas sp. FC4001]|jgi:hypothetical protein|uniref:hypothetical protein n=1 Tax=Selenomonas sp. FC4001 TaxID=1408313 RepID=UPI00055BAD88|nr:hypothetical protein [Selenomonas sp. FC4001]
MDKKFMNKLDVMELDMVAGGSAFFTSKECDKGMKKFMDKLENKVKNGVKEIKEFFDFFKPKWTQPGKPKNNILA